MYFHNEINYITLCQADHTLMLKKYCLHIMQGICIMRHNIRFLYIICSGYEPDEWGK